MSTPHNEAQVGQLAETVLLPGDPLRAQFIAETFFENPECVNRVRGMLAYSGTVHGKRVSVMGTGMGVPSIGIVSHELIHVYGAKQLIRVGSAGGMQPFLKNYDIVLAQGACTDSAYADHFQLPGTYAAIASWDLLDRAKKAADALGYPVHVGNVLTGDVFYEEDRTRWQAWQKMGVLAKEMECYALYMNAARAGVHALTILTVSDHMAGGPETTPEERQKSFTKMMEIALALA